jgi:hypothetical protein
MFDNREEGVMSFDELMAEGNTLEATEETPGTEDQSGESAIEEAPEVTQEETQETTEEGTESGDGTEAPAPIEEKTEEVEEQPETKTVNSSLTNLKQKYLDSGKWDDVVLNIDGEEVQLSELDSIDEETFLQIQEAQETLKQESQKDQYISKEGLNETSLKMIELQKNGGDISEAIQVYNEYVNPLKDLDLNNESIQEQLVRSSLRKKFDDPEVVELAIEKYKKDLVLDKKAQEVVEFTNKAFDKYLAQRNEEATKKKQEETEAHKKYVSQLEERYKKVELKPELKKQILSLADRNENGEYNAVEEVRKQLENPELAEELLYFIGNREAFKKSIGAKEKTKANLGTMKTINIVKDKQRKQSGGGSQKEDSIADFEFVEVPKL